MKCLLVVVAFLTGCAGYSPRGSPEAFNETGARRALGRALGYVSPDWVYHLEALHGGASPEYRKFTREFLAAAGEDAVPLARYLFEECASLDAKFLLACLLGEAGTPEAVRVLREIVMEPPDEFTLAAALHSIGMGRTAEGLDFLDYWLDEPPDLGPGRGYIHGAASLGIGLHGARAIDILLADARKNKAQTGYPLASDILARVRGVDATDRLRRIFETDPEEQIRLGAAMALGRSANPAHHRYWIGRKDYVAAGTALLEGWNVPDLWEATGAVRREVARKILETPGTLSGDAARELDLLRLAAVAPAESARGLFERLSVPLPLEADLVETQTVGVLFAFADQPDMDLARLRRLGDPESGAFMSRLDLGAVWAPRARKDLGRSKVMADLLALALAKAGGGALKHPNLLTHVMRAGYSEPELSAALKAAWTSCGAEDKERILVSIWGGVAVSEEQEPAPQRTIPRSFLASILRDEPAPRLRLEAAMACYVDAEPPLSDPESLRLIQDLMTRTWTVAESEYRAGTWAGPRLIRLMDTWYAREGTPADVSILKHRVATSSILGPRYLGEIATALDAIRLRHAGR